MSDSLVLKPPFPINIYRKVITPNNGYDYHVFMYICVYVHMYIHVYIHVYIIYSIRQFIF